MVGTGYGQGSKRIRHGFDGVSGTFSVCAPRRLNAEEALTARKGVDAGTLFLSTCCQLVTANKMSAPTNTSPAATAVTSVRCTAVIFTDDRTSRRGCAHVLQQVSAALGWQPTVKIYMCV